MGECLIMNQSSHPAQHGQHTICDRLSTSRSPSPASLLLPACRVSRSDRRRLADAITKSQLVSLYCSAVHQHLCTHHLQTTHQTTQGCHPLDPLSEGEVQRAAAACRAHAAALGLPPLRFNTISLQVQDSAPHQVYLSYDALRTLTLTPIWSFHTLPTQPPTAPSTHVDYSLPHVTTTSLPPVQEPAKQQLLQYESGALRQLPRLSLCILQTPPEFVVYEAIVDLQPHAGAAAVVVAWTKVGGAAAIAAVCLRAGCGCVAEQLAISQ